MEQISRSKPFFDSSGNSPDGSPHQNGPLSAPVRSGRVFWSAASGRSSELQVRLVANHLDCRDRFLARLWHAATHLLSCSTTAVILFAPIMRVRRRPPSTEPKMIPGGRSAVTSPLRVRASLGYQLLCFPDGAALIVFGNGMQASSSLEDHVRPASAAQFCSRLPSTARPGTTVGVKRTSPKSPNFRRTSAKLPSTASPTRRVGGSGRTTPNFHSHASTTPERRVFSRAVVDARPPTRKPPFPNRLDASVRLSSSPDSVAPKDVRKKKEHKAPRRSYSNSSDETGVIATSAFTQVRPQARGKPMQVGEARC